MRKQKSQLTRAEWYSAETPERVSWETKYNTKGGEIVQKVKVNFLGEIKFETMLNALPFIGEVRRITSGYIALKANSSNVLFKLYKTPP